MMAFFILLLESTLVFHFVHSCTTVTVPSISEQSLLLGLI